jgi:hypothetical protein
MFEFFCMTKLLNRNSERRCMGDKYLTMIIYVIV